MHEQQVWHFYLHHLQNKTVPLIKCIAEFVCLDCFHPVFRDTHYDIVTCIDIRYLFRYIPLDYHLSALSVTLDFDMLENSADKVSHFIYNLLLMVTKILTTCRNNSHLLFCVQTSVTIEIKYQSMDSLGTVWSDGEFLDVPDDRDGIFTFETDSLLSGQSHGSGTSPGRSLQGSIPTFRK